MEKQRDEVIIKDETENVDQEVETITKKSRLNDNKLKVTKEESITWNEKSSYDNNNNYDQQKEQIKQHCPYLGTIKRHLLDFDFEKLCSVTLTNLNVYACLICGKYYQGRGKSSLAYFHSLEQGHHVFINLHDCKIYCLPDNYEVDDISLNDIKVIFVLELKSNVNYIVQFTTKF